MDDGRMTVTGTASSMTAPEVVRTMAPLPGRGLTRRPTAHDDLLAQVS